MESGYVYRVRVQTDIDQKAPAIELLLSANRLNLAL